MIIKQYQKPYVPKYANYDYTKVYDGRWVRTKVKGNGEWFCLKKGDIVANTHQSDGNPYKHQMVVGTFCGKGAMTIDYMGNSHRFDNAQEHMEVVGHLKEYDDYMNALKRLFEYK